MWNALMVSGADRTTRTDRLATSYVRWSPTSGMSSSRQAICQTRFQSFSTSRRWNSAVVNCDTGTKSGPGSIRACHRSTSGTPRLSVSSSSW